LVAFPDDDQAVVRLSESHGPAWLDLVGVIGILFGFAAFVAGTWKDRHRVLPRTWAITSSMFVLGNLISAWSVVTDEGAWWMGGIALAALAQALVAARILASRSAGPSGGSRARKSDGA